MENKKKQRRMPFSALRRRLNDGCAAKDYSSSSFFGLYWAMMFCTSFDGTLS
jgi:hypothetical protein